MLKIMVVSPSQSNFKQKQYNKLIQPFTQQFSTSKDLIYGKADYLSMFICGRSIYQLSQMEM